MSTVAVDVVGLRTFNGSIGTPLSVSQQTVVDVLVRFRGAVVSEEVLIQRVYAGARESNWPGNVVRGLISNLRDRGFNIENVKGRGYRLVPPGGSRMIRLKEQPQPVGDRRDPFKFSMTRTREALA